MGSIGEGFAQGVQSGTSNYYAGQQNKRADKANTRAERQLEMQEELQTSKVKTAEANANIAGAKSAGYESVQADLEQAQQEVKSMKQKMTGKSTQLILRDQAVQAGSGNTNATADAIKRIESEDDIMQQFGLKKGELRPLEVGSDRDREAVKKQLVASGIPGEAVTDAVVDEYINGQHGVGWSGQVIELNSLAMATGAMNGASQDNMDVYEANNRKFLDTLPKVDDKGNVEGTPEYESPVMDSPDNPETIEALEADILEKGRRLAGLKTDAEVKKVSTGTPSNLQKMTDYMLTQTDPNTGKPYTSERALEKSQSMIRGGKDSSAKELQAMIDNEPDAAKRQQLKEMKDSLASGVGEQARQRKVADTVNAKDYSQTVPLTAATSAYGNGAGADTPSGREARIKAADHEASVDFTSKQEAQMGTFRDQVQSSREFATRSNEIEGMVASGEYKSGMLDSAGKLASTILPKEASDFMGMDKWYESARTDKGIDSALVDYVRSISGLTVTDKEYDRLKGILGGDYASEEARLADLKSFNRRLQDKVYSNGESLYNQGFVSSVPQELSTLDMGTDAHRGNTQSTGANAQNKVPAPVVKAPANDYGFKKDKKAEAQKKAKSNRPQRGRARGKKSEQPAAVKSAPVEQKPEERDTGITGAAGRLWDSMWN